MQSTGAGKHARRASFVSTVRPTRSQRLAATALVAVCLLAFLVLAAFARQPLVPIPAFLPLYQSALITFDLVTCLLLLGQFRMLRSRALLVLAAAYAFSALLAIAHALSFPGVVSEDGIFGQRPQATAWLYFFWHAGFAALVLAYARSASRAHARGLVAGRAAAAWSLSLAVLLAAVAVVLVSVFHDALPPLMHGNIDAPAKLAVAMVTWALGILALFALHARRPRTTLDLWLMVVMFVWICDTALAAVLNGARFDLGWYAGRLFGLLANGFVLAVLLLESGSLYARLARSNRLLGAALHRMHGLNADLDAFAGSLAHDLRQPLLTIAAHAQIAQRLPTTANQPAHLAKIVDAAERARTMIEALLEFARLGDTGVARAPVDMNDVIARAREAATAAHAEGTTHWQVARLPQVQGDAGLLVLAFGNLLSNALKYSRDARPPRIAIDAGLQPGGGHVIHVRDNGIGFDMAEAGQLFRPFSRLHGARHFQGTGMGLANVRRIVERHGGTVSAHAAPGQGAVFSVVLPPASA